MSNIIVGTKKIFQAWSVNVFRNGVGKRGNAACTTVLGLLFVALSFIAAPSANAQLDAATLNGTVTDPSGAAIPGATVVVTNKDTGVEHTVVSNADGAYTVPSLTPGNYIVTVSKTGFSNSKENGITLQVAQIATVNASLKVGNNSQTVEVSASTAFLDTSDASLGTVIPEQQVTDLPLNGRQFSELLQLSPGTVPIDNSQNAGKAPNFGAGAASPGVDGQTNRSNIFFLDGIIASNPFFGGFSFSPSVDAIQEFKAQSHTDQSEYGQASGAIVSVVSRSGTNTIHGAAYEFVRNQAFDAQNAFDTRKAAYHQNQYGASFGGPIKKDKLFYYANYEGGRLIVGSSSASDSTVPTAAERSGNFSGVLPGNISPTIYDPSTFNPVTFTESPFPGNQVPTSRINTGMLAYLNGLYPLPNQSLNSSGINNYLSSAQSSTNNDQGTIRVDYTIGQKDSVNGRFSENRANLASSAGLDNLFTTGFSGENTGATWVHTFGSSLVSEITGGYNRLNIPQAIETPVSQAALYTASGVGAGFPEHPGDTTNSEVPGYSLEGGNYTGYWNGGGPIGPMNIVQVGGSATKTQGAHSMKFGASYYHTWMYTNWNYNQENFAPAATWNAACQFVSTSTLAAAQCPDYDPTGKDPTKTSNLATAAGGDAVASMLLSLPVYALRNLGNSGVNLIESTPAIFAQDSWRVNPKLTLNYGLRWDYSAPMKERNNRLETYDTNTQTYEIAHGDSDLPSSLPAHVVELNRNTVLTSHYGDFSPRVGFAYQITPKTTVRMGVGRTFDDWGLPLQVGQQGRGNWPSGLAQVASTSNLNSAGISHKPDGTVVTGQNPFYGAAVLPPTPFPAGGGEGFQEPNWVPASSIQWNAEVEQNLGKIGVLSVAYVGSHTEHQTTLYPYNTAPAQVAPLTSNAAFPDQVFGNVGNFLRSNGWANYESFQTKLTRAFSNGLAYNAAFTYSQTNAFSSCNGDFSNVCISDPYNTAADYGPSDLDIPLIFTFNATYALPFGTGKQFVSNGIPAKILGDWQINTILATRSGIVVNPTIGGANNGDVANIGYNNAGDGSERENFVGDPNKGAPHKRTEWWNTSAFAAPAAGTFGNAGINSLRGPGYWDDDLSLFRDIPVNEQIKFQFRLEAFDVFNHPNLNTPGGSVDNGGFNTITSTVSTSGPGSQRELQLALKLLF